MENEKHMTNFVSNRLKNGELFEVEEGREQFESYESSMRYNVTFLRLLVILTTFQFA